MVLHIQMIVDIVSDLAGNLTLRLSNVVLAEEELSVQVRNLDVVVVSDGNFTLSRATNTHKSESLYVLASEGAGTDHEGVNFG